MTVPGLLIDDDGHYFHIDGIGHILEISDSDGGVIEDIITDSINDIITDVII